MRNTGAGEGGGEDGGRRDMGKKTEADLSNLGRPRA